MSQVCQRSLTSLFGEQRSIPDLKGAKAFSLTFLSGGMLRAARAGSFDPGSRERRNLTTEMKV
jgi:hypothetical protein